MTVSYGFYNSLAGDRLYDAIQLGSIFNGIITDGVYLNYGGHLIVTPQGGNMNVVVASGRAWFNGTWTLNDSNLVLTIDDAEPVFNRIDAVILEVDTGISVRANSIKILKGTPGTTPVNPTLTNNGSKYQYALAYIYISGGSSVISSGNITNNIGSINTPLVKSLVNNFSEVDLTSGWVIDSDVYSYISSDGATAILSVPNDKSNVLKEGMRIKLTQDQPLTVYWDLNANSNSQVGSHNGVDTAITYSAGKFGNGAVFNGTTSKILIVDHANLRPTGDFTVGFYFKSNVTGVTQTMFQSYAQTVNMAGFKIQANANNVIQLLTAKNTGNVVNQDYFVLAGSTNICDNQQHYIVVTCKAGYYQIYLDDVLEIDGWFSNPVYASPNYVRIGCANNTGTDLAFMTGQIDDLFVINGYALDEETIRSKYRSNTAQGTSSISIVKKAFITKVGIFTGGLTQITIWGGSDFSFINSTISNVFYSSAKAPLGFNLDPKKWSVSVFDYISRSQATPTLDTYYNIANLQLSLPIGSWNVSFSVLSGLTITTVAALARLTLKTALTTAIGVNVSDLDLIHETSIPAPGSITGAVVRTLAEKNKLIKNKIKTTYYLVALISNSGATNPSTLEFRGDILYSRIRAISAYL